MLQVTWPSASHSAGPPGGYLHSIESVVAAKPKTDAPPLSYSASEFKQILPISIAKVSE